MQRPQRLGDGMERTEHHHAVAGMCTGQRGCQGVFHARMAEEAGYFDIDDVVRGLVDKMVERHPHVFGSATISDADAQTGAWETMKAAERARKAEGGTPSAIDGVALGLPTISAADALKM